MLIVSTIGTMRHSRNSKNYAVLRAWLTSRRLEAGLTIRTLAEKLNVPHSVVGKIEDGSRKIELFEFISYCQAVGVDPLVGFENLIEELKRERISIP